MTQHADTFFIESARRTIALEGAAISALSSALDESFAEACRHIMSTAGRVVVTGIGKSGHIAGKVAATLASTGSPAFFVHPAEASHGDMGMVTRDDCVIALSNSGSTSEVMTLLPLIKRLRIPLIAITGDPQSELAQAADAHVLVAIDTEACPLNLAPTASTTAALVIGDALAIATLEARGFTAEEFAFSHPGGALGKRLLLRVADIMVDQDGVPSVTPSATVAEALYEMTQKGLGMTTVVSEQRELKGVFTDGDLKRLIQKKRKIANLKIKSFITKNPFCVEENTLATDVLKQMNKKQITNVCVFKKGNKKKTVGVIHIHDLIKNLK